MFKEKYLEIRWIPLFLRYCFLTLHFSSTELLKEKTIASTQLLHSLKKPAACFTSMYTLYGLVLQQVLTLYLSNVLGRACFLFLALNLFLIFTKELSHVK